MAVFGDRSISDAADLVLVDGDDVVVEPELAAGAAVAEWGGGDPTAAVVPMAERNCFAEAERIAQRRVACELDGRDRRAQ